MKGSKTVKKRQEKGLLFQQEHTAGRGVLQRIILPLICVILIALLVVGVYIIVRSGSSEVTNSQLEMTTVNCVKGITFSVPSSWVRDDQPSISQTMLYHNLSDFNAEEVNAISITSSWVEKDFKVSGYVDTFCEALRENSAVASVEQSTFKVGSHTVYQVSIVNNGVFGGYLYFKDGNVIVEILYATQEVDNLPQYEQEANDILTTLKFTGAVTEQDFPKVEESSTVVQDSAIESSVEESSYNVSVAIGDTGKVVEGGVDDLSGNEVDTASAE